MGGGRNSPWVVILFLSLYCATQGLYDSWDEAFELTYLDSYGVDVDMVGLTQTLAIIPWCFKVYISMPSDIMRMRLPFCALGLMISGGMFLAITTIDPKEQFAAYCVAMIVRNCGIALADGATEGFSVDCKLDEISGTMQAWMQVGRMIGMILGAAVAGELCKNSYSDALIFLGVSILVFIPVNFIVNEETDPLPYDPHRSWGALFVPFLYPKAVVDRNLQFIKHADEAAEAAQAAALKVKLALKDGGIGAAVKAAPEIVHASSQTALVESGVSPTGSNGGGDSPDGGADAAALALLHEHDKKLVDGDSEFQILVALVKKTPVWCFILFVFVTNLGTYIASFPIVLYLTQNHGFTVDEVGYLTVVGCVGNMAASFLFGYLFDYISSKRLTLATAAIVSAGTYLLFLPSRGKGALYMAQFAISAGTGLLYTVQNAMVRILADERIGGSFFGIVLSSMNIAALTGTALGGVISAAPVSSFAGTGFDGYEWCYLIGAIFGLLGTALVPWITSEDPNLRDRPKQSFSQSFRKLRRRASQYLGFPVPPEEGGEGGEGGDGSGAVVVPNPVAGGGKAPDDGSSLFSPAKTALPGARRSLRTDAAAAAAAAPDADGKPGTWLPPMGSMRNIVGEEGKGFAGILKTSGVWDKIKGKQAAQHAREARLAMLEAANRQQQAGVGGDHTGGSRPASMAVGGGVYVSREADADDFIRGSHAPRQLPPPPPPVAVVSTSGYTGGAGGSLPPPPPPVGGAYAAYSAAGSVGGVSMPPLLPPPPVPGGGERRISVDGYSGMAAAAGGAGAYAAYSAAGSAGGVAASAGGGGAVPVPSGSLSPRGHGGAHGGSFTEGSQGGSQPGSYNGPGSLSEQQRRDRISRMAHHTQQQATPGHAHVPAPAPAAPAPLHVGSVGGAGMPPLHPHPPRAH